MTTIDELWDSEAEQEALGEIVERRYQSMLSAVHVLVADLLGVNPQDTFRLDDEATRRVLEHAAERVVRIDETTRSAIAEHLQRGQELGLSNWEIANGTADFPGLDHLFTETWRGRSDLIARTELAEAQRVSALDRYAASGLVDHVRVVDGDYDAFCASRNGQVVPLANAPQLAHPACLIPGQVVYAPNGEAASSRSFEGEVVVIRTASDDLLTCTPNHPVLTDRGWRAAGQLREGDHVIRCMDSQRVASVVDPDHSYRPTLIEDVADTFGPSRGSSSATMPLSPEDFHGDGTDGDVDVVWPDRFGGDAFSGQHRQQLAFDRTLVSNGALLPVRSAGQVVKGLLGASHSFMGSGGQRETLSGSHIRHADFHGLGSRSNGPPAAMPGTQQVAYVQAALGCEGGAALSSEVALIESAKLRGVPGRFPIGVTPEGKPLSVQRFAERFRVRSDQPGHIFDALPGLVERVCVRQVSHRHFRGHVHNLQTTQGWYIAEGIITHNCRLVVVPIVREAGA